MPNFSVKNALFRFNAGFLSARIGEWLFTVALNWAIFVETQSPLLLAAINACRLLPNLFLSVPAGIMADRLDRRVLNFGTSVVNAGLIALIGFALFVKTPFWGVALLVLVRAVVTAAEGPWRNALLCHIFAGERLKSAVAQNASVMNLGRIIGPVMGGVLLAAMLRAAEIPSRVAVGVIYVERFAGERDVFGYHMWTQALIDQPDPVWNPLPSELAFQPALSRSDEGDNPGQRTFSHHRITPAGGRHSAG